VAAALPQASNRGVAGLPRSAIVGGSAEAEHGDMNESAGHDQALILIRTAADRIRRGYLDGTLEPATAGTVERALADLDRLGKGGGLLRRRHRQDRCAPAGGGAGRGRFPGGRAADRVRGQVLAAATIRGDRVATGEAVSPT
jgi:hypothetical protein